MLWLSFLVSLHFLKLWGPKLNLKTRSIYYIFWTRLKKNCAHIIPFYKLWTKNGTAGFGQHEVKWERRSKGKTSTFKLLSFLSPLHQKDIQDCTEWLWPMTGKVCTSQVLRLTWSNHWRLNLKSWFLTVYIMYMYYSK